MANKKRSKFGLQEGLAGIIDENAEIEKEDELKEIADEKNEADLEEVVETIKEAEEEAVIEEPEAYTAPAQKTEFGKFFNLGQPGLKFSKRKARGSKENGDMLEKQFKTSVALTKEEDEHLQALMEKYGRGRSEILKILLINAY